MQARFRHDINGLRAVGVLSVILFHLRVWQVSGGFVGVDVFFVISGFLMTQIIVGGLDRGDFNLWRFYGQRLARILPALTVMAGVVTALGWFILIPQQLILLATEAVYSVLFAVNVHYATDTGYFSPLAAQSWFLHCWSLAVEFQFYIVYPLILMAARRWGGRRGLLIALAATGSLSAIWSAVQTMGDPAPAFYLMPARLWEFAVGGLVVFIPPSLRRSAALPWVGLALILASVLGYDDTLKYPGLWPALPVLGAATIIYGQTPTFLLANPIAQFFGTISYSLYLWHWPLLLAARYFGRVEKPLGVALLFAAMVLTAWLSYLFVETPFRAAWQLKSRIRIAVPVTALAVLVAACGLIVRHNGAPRRLPDDIAGMIDTAQ